MSAIIQTAVELQFRNLIADKEAIVANMNHDIAKYGEWQCDWNSALDSINKEIYALLKP